MSLGHKAPLTLGRGFFFGLVCQLSTGLRVSTTQTDSGDSSITNAVNLKV